MWDRLCSCKEPSLISIPPLLAGLVQNHPKCNDGLEERQDGCCVYSRVSEMTFLLALHDGVLLSLLSHYLAVQTFKTL